MKSFGTLLKNELKLNIRNMNMVIFAVIMPLIINNSHASVLNAVLSSLTFAPSRIPYVVIPSVANSVKQETIDLLKSTLPIPSTDKVLDTYANDKTGKNNELRDRIRYKI